jgi:hypothetical protein
MELALALGSSKTAKKQGENHSKQSQEGATEDKRQRFGGDSKCILEMAEEAM